MKSVLVKLAHVLAKDKLHDVIFKHFQLEVDLAMIIREYRDSILQLVSIRIGCIVH